MGTVGTKKLTFLSGMLEENLIPSSSSNYSKILLPHNFVVNYCVGIQWSSSHIGHTQCYWFYYLFVYLFPSDGTQLLQKVHHWTKTNALSCLLKLKSFIHFLNYLRPTKVLALNLCAEIMKLLLSYDNLMNKCFCWKRKHYLKCPFFTQALPLPHEVFDRRDQAAYYHTLPHMFGCFTAEPAFRCSQSKSQYCQNSVTSLHVS